MTTRGGEVALVAVEAERPSPPPHRQVGSGPEASSHLGCTSTLCPAVTSFPRGLGGTGGRSCLRWPPV